MTLDLLHLTLLGALLVSWGLDLRRLVASRRDRRAMAEAALELVERNDALLVANCKARTERNEAQRQVRELRARLGQRTAQTSGEWPEGDPGEVARLRRQLHLSTAARRGLADRCQLLQAANEALERELAPNFRHVAERHASWLSAQTRAASGMPTAPGPAEPGVSKP